jgi:hypothetical protein
MRASMRCKLPGVEYEDPQQRQPSAEFVSYETKSFFASLCFRRKS